MSPSSTTPHEPSTPETLGSVIRAERERQGLSMRQLASLVGVQASGVILWERDETVPKAKYLSALARVLELSTSDLMTLSGAEYPHDAPTLPAMLRAEYDMPPEAISEIERSITRVAKKYGASKRPGPTPKPTRSPESSSHERRTP
jgi:transcriptional regulator with XRE-family HTH domain